MHILLSNNSNEENDDVHYSNVSFNAVFQLISSLREALGSFNRVILKHSYQRPFVSVQYRLHASAITSEI